MLNFVLRRCFSLVVVLFCVVSITFLLVRLSPGGPFSRERKIPPAIEKQLMARYKMDGSIWVQYTSYLGDLLKGDLRLSTQYRDRSVKELIAAGFPVTAALGFSAFLVATVFGVTLGSAAAVRKNTPSDTAAMLCALLLISIPTFVVGPILIYLLALKLAWLPVGGWTSWRSLILPTLTLAGPYIAYIARLQRSSMLEVLGQDFIRTARAKGLGEGRVIFQHALKMSILPVVSFSGPLAANLLTGSIVVEAIFNIPGMGGYFVNSVFNKDAYLLAGAVIVYCTLLVVLNFLVDIGYTFLDRRIQLYE